MKPFSMRQILKDTSFFKKKKKKKRRTKLMQNEESSKEANIKAIFKKNNSHTSVTLLHDD